MSLDGAMLRLLAKEIENRACGAKVDKVHQPSREELVLILRSREGNLKLLLSARANSPRVQFTEDSIENPAAPPMFCMLMRKRLIGSRLARVRQQGFERVLMLDFEAFNELGDAVTLTLAVEIMGRCSNIILIDENNRIVDSIKRVDDETSSQRLVLPSLFYEPVPAQDKISLSSSNIGQCVQEILTHSELPLWKAVLTCVQGISPIVAREIAYRAAGDTVADIKFMPTAACERLEYELARIASLLEEGGTPVMVYDLAGKPIDFTFTDILQYGEQAILEKADNYSVLLEKYYGERDAQERMRVKSNDLHKLLSNLVERVSRKIAAQSRELEESARGEEKRICGDLITANLYAIEKGASSAHLLNYYSESGEYIDIPLDPMLTPSQNAQKYYREYRKAQSAQEHLRVMLEQGTAELEYLESVLDSLSRARSEKELALIREELATQGYLRMPKNAKEARKKKPAAMPPLKFMSSDGFEILVGRNNTQNDALTLRTAERDDIWLHTLNIPGSHTIICANGREVPNSTIEQAAIIAAVHSKARMSGLVAVDYTKVRYVSKPNGAKPGRVIYTHQSTLYIRPDEKLADSLKVQ